MLSRLWRRKIHALYLRFKDARLHSWSTDLWYLMTHVITPMHVVDWIFSLLYFCFIFKMKLLDVQYLEVVYQYEHFDRECTSMKFRGKLKCQCGVVAYAGQFRALRGPNRKWHFVYFKLLSIPDTFYSHYTLLTEMVGKPYYCGLYSILLDIVFFTGYQIPGPRVSFPWRSGWNSRACWSLYCNIGIFQVK
jgi:hypothetical protein